VTSSIGEEVDKMTGAIRWGADTVMDCPPAGTSPRPRMNHPQQPGPDRNVPIIRHWKKQEARRGPHLGNIPRHVIEQAEQGVGLLTIHAGVRLPFIPLTANRMTGIVVARRLDHGEVVPVAPRGELLYTRFEEICEICGVRRLLLARRRACGRAPSMTQMTKPSSLIAYLSELTKTAWKHDCQVMIEGRATCRYQLIKENMELQLKYWRRGAVLHPRPLATDIAPGYDHITSAIGAALIAGRHGDALFLRDAQDTSGCRTRKDVKDGIMAYRSPRTPRPRQGPSGAQARDKRALTRRARVSAGPTSSTRPRSGHRQGDHDETLPQEGAKVPHFCSMCGALLLDEDHARTCATT